MLNHRTMMRISLGVILSMCLVFIGGYVVGFQKAEHALTEQTPNMVRSSPGTEVVLPILLSGSETVISDPEKMRPNTSLFTEAGKTVEVDNPDEQRLTSHEANQSVDLAAIRENKLEDRLDAVPKTMPEARQIENLAKPEEVKVPSKLVDKLEGQLVGKSENTQSVSPVITGEAIGGPAESDPAMIMNEDEANQIAIYDNANEETASYSIQVGMFGSLENAERKVEELIAVDLSAYLVEYMNKQSKMRYKVRFGYFADRKSAMNALSIYEKELTGSGYVVPLKPKVRVDA